MLHLWWFQNHYVAWKYRRYGMPDPATTKRLLTRIVFRSQHHRSHCVSVGTVLLPASAEHLRTGRAGKLQQHLAAMCRLHRRSFSGADFPNRTCQAIWYFPFHLLFCFPAIYWDALAKVCGSKADQRGTDFNTVLPGKVNFPNRHRGWLSG